jgi:hypothetical protein
LKRAGAGRAHFVFATLPVEVINWMATTNIALYVFLVGLVGKVLHLW